MRKIGKVTMSAAVAAAVGLVAAACSSSPSTTSNASTVSSGGNSSCKSGQTSNVVALSGFQVCLFASATTTMNHPDDIQVVGDHVWIGWQNQSAKDGSTKVPSTLAEYDTSGKLVKTWSLIGHVDGLTMDPATNTMWVTANEDAKPNLYLVNPSSSSFTTVTVPPLPHGGGLDDLRFVNGSAYISASNPTLNSAGINTHPAIYKVTVSGTAAHLTGVFNANAKATTLNPPISTMTLNLTDPDSQTIDPSGDLVLNSQGDQELIFVHSIGTKSQKLTVLSLGAQVDDTVWPTSSKGCMIIADNASGVYSVCSDIWVTGTPIVDAANDGTTISFAGSLNLGTGQITPFLVGMNNPHGMGFIAK
ncbi:MAG TPA: hypothetical protein VGI66_19080 [Streptosporangiaceae bacterium]